MNWWVELPQQTEGLKTKMKNNIYSGEFHNTKNLKKKKREKKKGELSTHRYAYVYKVNDINIFWKDSRAEVQTKSDNKSKPQA